MQKDCLTSDRKGNFEWSSKWRRQLRGGAEESQYVDLMNELLEFSWSNEKDKWIWDLGIEEVFQVPESDKIATRFVDMDR
ncbi:hypothetical protein L1987_03599 [Smallanthus sonchifolius]|uniref:Uncharacterized protein n=1 Tax=Smallanthus sonchifolius TaxID=185202 RepID=A0ACB9KB42_9ASTR|nr:hypothetical protein L1987_03599 [Smallanthus sonchifolius]